MANKQHLEKIKEGVEAWNIWRNKNPDIYPDISHSNLSNKDLSNADFSKTDITGTNFSNSKLLDTNFYAACSEPNINSQVISLTRSTILATLFLIAANLTGVLATVCGIFILQNYKDFNADSLNEQGRFLILILSLIYFILFRFPFLNRISFTIFFIAILSSIIRLGYQVLDIWYCIFTIIIINLISSAYKGVKPSKNSALWFGGVFGIFLSSSTFIQLSNIFYTGMSQEETALAISLTAEWIFYSLIIVIVNIFASQSIYSNEIIRTPLENLVSVLVSFGGTKFNSSDLSRANFSEAILIDPDFRNSNVNRTCFRNVRGLERARLDGTILVDKSVRNLLVKEKIELKNFQGKDLKGANLNSLNLEGFNFAEADLIEASLESAILSNVNLARARLFRASLTKANLTGACVENIGVDSKTNLSHIICDYVYFEEDQNERRPRIGAFKTGEFESLFQQAVGTIDLVFQDGIDWQAFFQSFQDLRSQYADQDLAIQAIEKKQGGAFVVRLEVAGDADKKAIESSAKELYETKLLLTEERYRAELKAKDGEIIAYREQSANLLKITEMLAARPPISEGNQYVFNQSQIAGGVADTVQGSQYGGTINNYTPNTQDITRLLTTLRNQAQTFPTDQKDEALDTLEALQDDLAKPEPDQPRIGRRLKKLVALDAAISLPTRDFTNKVIELTEKLGIPIEQVQLPPSSDS
ncbi:pentapeptide repeat-containing protein [Leptothoe sp. EHU-05/26/07-4]